MHVGDGAITMVGYDGELEICHTITADVSSPGSIAIRAKLLKDAIQTLRTPTVALMSDESGVLTIQCGTTTFTLNGCAYDPAHDMATEPQLGSFNVLGDTMRRLIQGTVACASPVGPSDALKGVLTIVDGARVEMVATDAYRLAWAKGACSTDFVGRQELIVPARVYREVVSMIAARTSDVTVRVGETTVRCSVGSSSVASRLIQGNYPTWERVIPSTWSTRVVFAQEQLLAVAKRMAPIARSGTGWLLFDLSAKQCAICAKNHEVGRSVELVTPMHYEGNPIVIGLNAGSVLTAIEQCGPGEIAIELRDPELAPVFRSVGRDDWLGLIMPTRVT